jgi:hypothetical protein
MTHSDFTPLTGLVTCIGKEDVKFNFGAGPEWVPMWAIQEQSFEVGLCCTWNILTDYAIKRGMVC